MGEAAPRVTCNRPTAARAVPVTAASPPASAAVYFASPAASPSVSTSPRLGTTTPDTRAPPLMAHARACAPSPPPPGRTRGDALREKALVAHAVRQQSVREKLAALEAAKRRGAELRRAAASHPADSTSHLVFYIPPNSGAHRAPSPQPCPFLTQAPSLPGTGPRSKRRRARPSALSTSWR